ncbi:MAG: ATP synthase F1 subunit gamma [Flavobacteriales bacterium]|nr:ATP synthase F1 subunit gamma [Flavobacteriales bacterium]MEB2340955.1 ATP synthase F1 subunit gamma [Flavobacteriia bacterium]
MASLKEVRNRIVSVNSTKQITAAMKMVSAAKLRRAQDAIIRMRPYAEKLGEVLGNVSASLDASENKYAHEREVKNVLFVAIVSNRGLAGAFNTQVFRLITKATKAAEARGENVHVLSVGKKAADHYRRSHWHAQGLPTDLARLFDQLTFDNVAPVAEAIMAKYAGGDYDRVVLFYNRFKNAATQIITEEQFLPVVRTVSAEADALAAAKTDHIMEPDRQTIVEEIIPKSLKIQFYKALLDSFAAEHGARMTAMHKATDNADELLKELRLSYNKARQAAITGEILEIVGGAEALKG